LTRPRAGTAISSAAEAKAERARKRTDNALNKERVAALDLDIAERKLADAVKVHDAAADVLEAAEAERAQADFDLANVEDGIASGVADPLEAAERKREEAAAAVARQREERIAWAASQGPTAISTLDRTSRRRRNSAGTPPVHPRRVRIAAAATSRARRRRARATSRTANTSSNPSAIPCRRSPRPSETFRQAPDLNRPNLPA
jgi:hypothetical protein